MYYSNLKKIILDSSHHIEEIFSSISDKNFLILPINNNVSGHYCTNFFFNIKCSDQSKHEFLQSLTKNNFVQNAEIIKGYLNLTLTPSYFIKRIQEILTENILPNIGDQEKVNIEFCSVNPTGYLHIGHARNAILGDSIARILEKVNYAVTKEYYINDGGNQINLMAESIYARFCELHDIEHQFPENGYKGPEMYDVAKKLKKDTSIDSIKRIAVKFFLKKIKTDLKNIHITYNSWIFESDIITNKHIEKALNIFKEKNFIEFDVRSDKKVSKGEISNNKLMLLKTTLLGDDQDRPLTKSDGSWTYFAPDVGYHFFKIERDFKFLICVLGADHDSYAKRIKIATHLLNPSVRHETPICQMVSFDNDGCLVKFSKRMGNSIRLSDFIKDIPSDILRFMILEKSADTQFIFNYENAVNISMKNPLFYCQYAFARACSILRNIKTKSTEINLNSVFFHDKDVQAFIIAIDSFSYVIDDTVKNLAPHKLANYTKKLCESMHKVWQIGKIDPEKRIIIENNPIETNSRKLLIDAFIKVAKECFYCLGINAPEKME